MASKMKKMGKMPKMKGGGPTSMDRMEYGRGMSKVMNQGGMAKGGMAKVGMAKGKSRGRG